MRGHSDPSKPDREDRDRFGRLGGPSFRGGCCFLVVLLVVAMTGRVAYVQITDHRALVAATRRCTQDQVLEIRQPQVWLEYVSRSPSPSHPPDPGLVQQRRAIEQHDLRVALGLNIASFAAGDDNVIVLSNTNGEVARLRFVIASSIGFSIEGPRTQIFDCYGQRPNLYRYSYLFT